MKILLTGATGFLGGLLRDRLEQEGFPLLAVSGFSREIPGILHPGKAEFTETIREFRPEAVLHLAAFSTAADDRETVLKLVESNLSFGSGLMAALPDSVRLFINTGSFAESGEGAAPYFYAATKRAFRELASYFAERDGYRLIHAVPFTVFGRKEKEQKVIDHILSSLDAVNPVAMTLGEQNLDFVHADDIIDFYLTALRGKERLRHREYQLGTGRGTTIRELAAEIERLTGKRANINWGERPYRPRDVMKAVADFSAAAEDLDWRAGDLETGLRKFLPLRGFAVE